jgi:hypothetical protein
LGTLRFFYVQVLKQIWSTSETPYPKKVLRLPQVLSQPGGSAAYRCGTDALSSHPADDALCHRRSPRRGGTLEDRDIDSRRMVIHIQGGKGRKDRDIMPSPSLLDALREYWRRLKHKAATWLFPVDNGIPRTVPSTPRSSGGPASTLHNTPSLSPDRDSPFFASTLNPSVVWSYLSLRSRSRMVSSVPAAANTTPGRSG